MKKLKTCALSVLLLLCGLFSNAQDQKVPINEPDYNKPKLFADLPQKMNLRVSEMETMFRFTMGAVVSIQLSDNFLLEGTVVSKAEDATVRSVVIRSSNRLGATFTFTRVTADGKDHYIGRMLSRNNGDAFEIALENGQYILLKKNLYDLISE